MNDMLLRSWGWICNGVAVKALAGPVAAVFGDSAVDLDEHVESMISIVAFPA